MKADVVWEDNDFLVINDIHPEAPVHVLIIPKKHIGDLSELKDGDAALMGKVFLIAEKVAKQLGIADKGYRLILNEGQHGGKLVPHLHVHLIGGKSLGPKLVK